MSAEERISKGYVKTKLQSRAAIHGTIEESFYQN